MKSFRFVDHIGSLRRLDIKFSFLPLTNFHLLLQLFPPITDLMFVTITTEMDYMSHSLWHAFLSTNLLHLTKLRFHMEIKGLSSLNNLIEYLVFPSRIVNEYCSMPIQRSDQFISIDE